MPKNSRILGLILSWSSNRIFDRPINGWEISSSVFGQTRCTRLYFAQKRIRPDGQYSMVLILVVCQYDMVYILMRSPKFWIHKKILLTASGTLSEKNLIIWEKFPNIGPLPLYATPVFAIFSKKKSVQIHLKKSPHFGKDVFSHQNDFAPPPQIYDFFYIIPLLDAMVFPCQSVGQL